MAGNILSELVGHDCTFELDRFGKPRLCSESETIKNALMFILFSRPGQYPSLPYLGMDIRNKLYSFYDEIDERALEEQLRTQCSALGPYFDSGCITVRKMVYRNMPSLLIYVSTDPSDTYAGKYIQRDHERKNLEFYIGLSVNEVNELLYNINARYAG